MIDIPNFGLACRPDPEDKRDYRLEALGAPTPVDWITGFSVPEPRDEDQGSSDGCGSYGTSYYHETIKPGKIFSRRDLFARVALSYGSTLRDNIMAVVNQGQATRDEVPDPENPTPQNMRDKTGITAEKQADDKELNGFAMNGDIDTVASTIRDYQGCLFGVIGDNKHWFASLDAMLNPNPPDGAVPIDYGSRQDLWGHALYGKGFHMHDGQKCIIAKSSWCKYVKEHHIKENYFKAGFVFNPWTLIPRKAYMKLVNDKGTIFLVAGITNKKKTGIATMEAKEALFGDEPVETGDTSAIPTNNLLDAGFIVDIQK